MMKHLKLALRCQLMAVEFQTLVARWENARFRSVWRRGFNWDSPQRFIDGYRPSIRPAFTPLPHGAHYCAYTKSFGLPAD